MGDGRPTINCDHPAQALGTYCGGCIADLRELITRRNEQILELSNEVARLQQLVDGRPDFQPPATPENRAAMDTFQRLWEACIGLSEKADFKAIFQHTLDVERRLKTALDAIQDYRNVIDVVLQDLEVVVCMHHSDAAYRCQKMLREVKETAGKR